MFVVVLNSGPVNMLMFVLVGRVRRLKLRRVGPIACGQRQAQAKSGQYAPSCVSTDMHSADHNSCFATQFSCCAIVTSDRIATSTAAAIESSRQRLDRRLLGKFWTH
jgi:hypothetical protein